MMTLVHFDEAMIHLMQFSLVIYPAFLGPEYGTIQFRTYHY